jgi:hypothetical protein
MTDPGFFYKFFVVIIIIFLFVISENSAAENYLGTGSKSIALADATVSLSGPFAIYYNQAGLAKLSRISISSFYRQKGMSGGYSDMGGVFCMPTSTGTFGVNFFQTGIDGYHESRAGLSFAKLLSPDFSVGFQFNYFMIDLPESATNKGTFVFEGGLQYSIVENIFLGAHVFNPFKAKIETLYMEKRIPMVLKCGAGFSLGKELLLLIEGVYSDDYPIVAKAGVEYTVIRNIFLRGGISGKPLNHFFGAGYKWKNISTDLAFSKHRLLGYFPSISLNYSF